MLFPFYRMTLRLLTQMFIFIRNFNYLVLNKNKWFLTGHTFLWMRRRFYLKKRFQFQGGFITCNCREIVHNDIIPWKNTSNLQFNYIFFTTICCKCYMVYIQLYSPLMKLLISPCNEYQLLMICLPHVAFK